MTNRFMLLLLSGCVVSLAAASPAAAAVITFNELTTSSMTSVNPVNSGGFIFAGNQGDANQLGVWSENDPANMDQGGAAIFFKFGGNDNNCHQTRWRCVRSFFTRFG